MTGIIQEIIPELLEMTSEELSRHGSKLLFKISNELVLEVFKKKSTKNLFWFCLHSINMVNAQLKQRDRMEVVKKMQEFLPSGRNSHQKVSITAELVFADLSNF